MTYMLDANIFRKTPVLLWQNREFFCFIVGRMVLICCQIAQKGRLICVNCYKLTINHLLFN